MISIRGDAFNPDSWARHIRTCREWPDPQAGNFQLLQLYTGMRRGEVRNLRWADVDLERGFIHIRDPKGGPRGMRQISEASRAIRDAAKLPADFRPNHGLRHTLTKPSSAART